MPDFGSYFSVRLRKLAGAFDRAFHFDNKIHPQFGTNARVFPDGVVIFRFGLFVILVAKHVRTELTERSPWPYVKPVRQGPALLFPEGGLVGGVQFPPATFRSRAHRWYRPDFPKAYPRVQRALEPAEPKLVSRAEPNSCSFSTKRVQLVNHPVKKFSTW